MKKNTTYENFNAADARHQALTVNRQGYQIELAAILELINAEANKGKTTVICPILGPEIIGELESRGFELRLLQENTITLIKW